MAAAMDGVYKRAHEEEASLSLSAIAMPYLWRLLGLVAGATAAGGWLARRAGVKHWWTAGLIALAATLLVLGLAWVITGPVWLPYAAPLIVGGLPAALWRLARRRRHRAGGCGARRLGGRDVTGRRCSAGPGSRRRQRHRRTSNGGPGGPPKTVRHECRKEAIRAGRGTSPRAARATRRGRGR